MAARAGAKGHAPNAAEFAAAHGWHQGLADGYCFSVAPSCPAVCHLMDYSTPGSFVLPYLPKLTQTHVHQVGHTIQPSHPLSPPSPSLGLSQHQGLF